MVVHRLARRWAAAAGLLAGLWSSGTAFAQSPTTAPAAAPVEAIAAPQSSTLFPRISTWFSTSADTIQPAADGPGVVVHDGAPYGDGPAHGGGGHDGDYWKGIPPIQSVARAGEFVVQPTGEGYYSLLDVIQGNYRQGPPKYAYPRNSICPPPFYDLDWSYLDDPSNEDHDWLDCLKRIKLFDDTVMFTTGGEFRIRTMNEGNHQLVGKNDDYQLTRERVYGDLWITNRFRIFAELFFAESFNQDVVPLPIDRNKGDFQNLFVDIGTLEIGDSPIWLRIGRQELCYGSQRLISALDWANTRRSFQGAKAFWQNEEFSLDAFVVQPFLPNPNTFWSDADPRQVFSGVWGTYRPEKGQTIDLYYLNLDRIDPVGVAFGGVGPKGDINTIGSRYAGNYGNVLWDFEGMLQWGSFAGGDLMAGAYAAEAGYNFKDLPLNPQFWVGYEWYSGTSHPTPGKDDSTFQQLFPFGHYYMGVTDIVGQQNIGDLSQQLTLFPTNWIQLQVQNHIYRLDSPTDALYNSGGTPIRQDKTGKSGSYVGDELDLVTNFHLTNHQDIQIGYCRLFAGGFIEKAPTVAPPPKGSTPGSRAADSTLLYVQYSYHW